MRAVEKVGFRRWLKTVLNEQLIGLKNGAESSREIDENVSQSIVENSSHFHSTKLSQPVT